MINRGNYQQAINEFGVENLNPEFKAQHQNYLDIQEYYNDDEDIKSTIDLYFAKLEKFISKHKGKEPKKVIKEKKPDATVTEQEKKNVKKYKEKNKKETAKKTFKAQLVRSLKEEVKFIKRFVGLHNKRKSADAILAFIKALQKSITQKLITKKSPFVKEIEFIQDTLIYVYNEIIKRRKKEELIEIDEKRLTKFASIAGGEAVFPSVGLMKAFIGMQGKELEAGKRDSFIKRLKNAVKNKKVLRDDPFAERLNNIYLYLTQKYKTGKKVEISKAELNGIEGIVNGCGCSKSLGRIYDTKGKTLRQCKRKTYSDAKKGACSHNRGLSGVMSAVEVANLKFDLLPFYGLWLNLFGKPEKNFSLMVHGEPGAGKSTFLIKFTKYLADFGSVLYISSEEYGSSTLTGLVNKYLNPIPDNVTFTSDINSVNISDYDFVIFDSINYLKLKLEDYKKIKKKSPNTAFILVLQHTKDGQYRGGKEWEHEAQIAGEIIAGKISIYKNRYGVKGSWNFFDN